jgi:hypothetical protein
VKDYKSYLNSLDFIQYENILMREKLEALKDEYKSESLYLDPRFVVPKDIDKLK